MVLDTKHLLIWKLQNWHFSKESFTTFKLKLSNYAAQGFQSLLPNFCSQTNKNLKLFFFFPQKSYAWAPCISQVQKTALLSIFSKRTALISYLCMFILSFAFLCVLLYNLRATRSHFRTKNEIIIIQAHKNNNYMYLLVFLFLFASNFQLKQQTQATASNLMLDNEKIARGRDILLRHPVKWIVYLFYWQVVSLFDCINPVQETGKEKIQ